LRAGLLIGALLAAAPGAAHAELKDALNWARTHGCAAGTSRTPLRDSSALRQAALAMSRGYPLHAALEAGGYRAAQSAAVHLSGAVGDAQVARALSAGYCSTVADPHLSEFGAVRRGEQVWMVMAAPLVVPRLEDASEVSRQILTLVNAARAEGRRCGGKYFAPAAPLRLNSALSDAALAHSREMAHDGQFAHRGRDGSTPAVRVERAGYGRYRVVGENIAAGALTPGEVTLGWLSSPAHCENIMDPRFVETGIAFAVNLSDREAVYWTQDFAAPLQHPSNPP